MSMQINVDPAGLTQEQREAVAGFILAYPSSTCHTSVACVMGLVPGRNHFDVIFDWRMADSVLTRSTLGLLQTGP